MVESGVGTKILTNLLLLLLFGSFLFSFVNTLESSISANGTNSSSSNNLTHNDGDVRMDKRMTVTSFKKLESVKPLKCGRMFDSYDSRIVGGKVATIAEFP